MYPTRYDFRAMVKPLAQLSSICHCSTCTASRGNYGLLDHFSRQVSRSKEINSPNPGGWPWPSSQLQHTYSNYSCAAQQASFIVFETSFFVIPEHVVNFSLAVNPKIFSKAVSVGLLAPVVFSAVNRYHRLAIPSRRLVIKCSHFFVSLWPCDKALASLYLGILWP